MSILVDTGGWYALADTADRHHAAAARYYRERAQEAAFATTDLILAETWTLVHAHLGRPAAMVFWDGLRETRIPIVSAEPVDLEAAWRIAQAFPDQTFSFVDCVTFAMMERLGITDVFGFDSHFLVYRYGPTRARAFRRAP